MVAGRHLVVQAACHWGRRRNGLSGREIGVGGKGEGLSKHGQMHPLVSPRCASASINDAPRAKARSGLEPKRVWFASALLALVCRCDLGVCVYVCVCVCGLGVPVRWRTRCESGESWAGVHRCRFIEHTHYGCSHQRREALHIHCGLRHCGTLGGVAVHSTASLWSSGLFPFQ